MILEILKNTINYKRYNFMGIKLFNKFWAKAINIINYL